MGFEVEKSETVFEGKRIVVSRDLVKQPDGSEVTRELVMMANAAAVVPVTLSGEIILLRQFRYPTGGMLIEIPAGVIEDSDGNDDNDGRCCNGAEETARRELLEETGCVAGEFKYLGRIHTSPGVCSEFVEMFLATDVKPAGDVAFGAKLNLDYGEVIEPFTVDAPEALRMVKTGEITDAKTICGLMLAGLFS